MVLDVGLLSTNIFIKWVAEMKMLRWNSVNIWKDKIHNDELFLKIRVASIDEKSHLRWFGHV